MKEEKNTNTSSVKTLLTDANLKNLPYTFCYDTIPLHNLLLWKQSSIVDMRLSPEIFSFKFFSQKVSCVKKNLKAIWSN